MSPPSKILFVIDPFAGLNPKKDSSLAMMRAFLARGDEVFITESSQINTGNNGLVQSSVQKVIFSTSTDASSKTIIIDNTDDRVNSDNIRPLNHWTAVIMRKDPPFDMSYVSALWLLRTAQLQGACVVNHPEAILNHNEKAAILEFPTLTPPTIVTSQKSDITRFLEHHGDIILKPLFGMGGQGIFRVKKDDANINVIMETLLHGHCPIMAQGYLPQIAQGDKRVFVINGKVIPYALVRIPMQGETRGNLAAGGRGVAMPITAEEKQTAERLCPILKQRGLIIVGLDMIGGRLTEINVTSPTCMVEIEKDSGYEVANQAALAVLEYAAQPTHP